MACLHLVSSERALSECLTIAADSDTVLLLGRAAVAAVSDVSRDLLVLEDDSPAGVSCAGNVTPIGYARFVELAADHQPIITWR